jgi:N-acetylneuraminic acid mutarotase
MPSRNHSPGRLIRRLASTLVPVLAAAGLGCGEDTPTQPDGATNPSPAPSFATASNSWTEKAPMPGPGDLYGISVGVAVNSTGQSILYTIGGVTSSDGFDGFPVRAYNLATNTWTTKSTGIDYFSTNGVGKIGSKLYFSGGQSFDPGEKTTFATLYAYDPVADRLTRKADMPKRTAEGVTGVINGKLYVLPGVCSTELWPDYPQYCQVEQIRRLYRYDPSTNTWLSRRDPPHFHRGGAAGVIDGKFYVAGGSDGVQAVAALDVYDPATNTWSTRAPLPVAGSGRGAVLGGKLFFISALHAYAYDPATNTWKARAAPPRGLDDLAKVTVDGHSYLVGVGGGSTVPSDPLHTLVYTP